MLAQHDELLPANLAYLDYLSDWLWAANVLNFLSLVLDKVKEVMAAVQNFYNTGTDATEHYRYSSYENMLKIDIE